MQINLSVVYYTEESKPLCFRHAIQYAMLGGDIRTEVDDFSSDYDMRITTCQTCVKGETQ